MKPDRLVVFRGADGEWRWQRRNGANGRIVAVSGEGYRRRSHAIGMVFALHEWAREVHIADGRDAGRVIDGWERSPGALAEVAVARALKLSLLNASALAADATPSGAVAS